MFDVSDDGSLNAIHHPFTAPSVDTKTLLENPEKSLSRAYDLVINGSEVGGGSIRIHKSEMQKTVLKLLGIEDEEAREKFGFLLDALDYGPTSWRNCFWTRQTSSIAHGYRLYTRRDSIFLKLKLRHVF